MSELDIIRAWKDKTYRNSLSADELAQLPENPAGTIELTNDELAGVDGAATPSPVSILTAASVVSVIVTSLATLIGYTGYRLGTNGSAASCCPCQPTPPSGS